MGSRQTARERGGRTELWVWKKVQRGDCCKKRALRGKKETLEQSLARGKLHNRVENQAVQRKAGGSAVECLVGTANRGKELARDFLLPGARWKRMCALKADDRRRSVRKEGDPKRA